MKSRFWLTEPRRTSLPEGAVCRSAGAGRNSRRCDWHDYKAPWIYLITASENPEAPQLANVVSEVSENAVRESADIRDYSMELTPLGEAVRKEIAEIPLHHPQMKIYSIAVMPDHIHFVLHVVEPLERELGRELAGFFGVCTKHWKRLAGLTSGNPLFRKFHDRILLGRGQLNTMIKYVEDNPRRLFIRKIFPDLFRRYNHLWVDNMEFAAYGNIFLLRNFNRLQVVVHRADSPEVRERNRRLWINCASMGGVLVSPFISADEREIRDRAIEAGGSLIVLRNNGFPERFKPGESEFNLCSQGRLLLLAPWPDRIKQETVSRAEALQMNELARRIASLSETSPMSLFRPPV